MRTLLLLTAGAAAGIIYYVYEWYSNRENQHPERPYGSGRDGPMSGDEEYIVINETRKLPGETDDCVVCLERLIRRDGDEGGYAIIALPKCRHWFHQKCAIRLLDYHPSCPVCREPISPTALRRTPVKLTAPLGNRNASQASTSTNSKKSD